MTPPAGQKIPAGNHVVTEVYLPADPLRDLKTVENNSIQPFSGSSVE